MLDNLFSRFEGKCSPYPLALFRIVFFSGLVVHFFPSLMWRSESYAHSSFRTNDWNSYLAIHFQHFPNWLITVLAVVTMIACIAALAGFFLRFSSAIAFAGLYLFSSFNALHTQTLALVTVWAILPLFVICGSGDEVLALRFGARSPSGRRLTRGLIVFQIFFGVFFAGIEKLIQGWPTTNEMYIVLNYPIGFVARPWLAGNAWMHSEGVGLAASIATLLVELGVPIMVLLNRCRTPAMAVNAVFFCAILALMEVPPLFFFMYAGASLLALQDSHFKRMAHS